MATFTDTYEIRFPRQSHAEELANSLSHGFGLILSVVGAAGLLVAAVPRVDLSEMIGLGLYTVAAISVFGASTLSHAIREPHWKHWWRIVDQAAIYLMIAGTYTPFILAYLPTALKWGLFSAVWGVAALGFFSKAVLRHRVDAVVVLNYILLGWVPAVVMLPFLPLDCIAWMAAGGGLYTIGAVFLSLDDRIPFFHTIWHLFVIAAAACQYYAIIRYVIA